jgi:hypothetical protein
MMTKPTLPHLPKKPKRHAMQQELIVMGFTPSTLAKIGRACNQYSQFQSLTGEAVDIEVRKFAKEADKIVKGEGV